nr:Na+ dependent nucleoside transporter N-terminal domain-containing protein [Serinicoccus sp. CUA-874]
MDVLWGIGGMAALIALALLLSTNRRAVRWRTVLAALGIQVLFGILVLYWSWGQRALEQVSQGVQAVINSSNAGIQFVFGPVLPQGEDAGVVFAFQVLPVIIFFASLTAVLYHFKILQFVVEKLGAAWARRSGPARPSRSTPPPTSSSARPRRRWSSAPTSRGSPDRACSPSWSAGSPRSRARSSWATRCSARRWNTSSQRPSWRPRGR